MTIITPYILILILTPCLSVSLNYDQFIQNTPKSFGLYIVPAETIDIQQFNKYLHGYAMMECQLIAEIFVVWTNTLPPHQVGIERDSQWRRPVIFGKSKGQEKYQLYQVSAESQVSVYFVMETNVVTSCQQLHHSFTLWREKSTGDIGPLMSYKTKGYDFITKSQIFIYADPEKSRFFSIAEISGSWVSKFYLEMLDSEGIWQINQIRQVARKQRYCNDIALNFVVEYFFPEMISTTLGGNLTYKATTPESPTINSQKTQCLKKFTQILGYNPLRLINKADSPNPKRYTIQSSNYILYLKRTQLAQRMQPPSSSSPSSSSDSQATIPNNNYNAEQSSLRQQLTKLKINLSQVRLKYKQMMLQQQQQQQQQHVTDPKPTTTSTSAAGGNNPSYHYIQDLNIKLNQIISLAVFILTMISIMIGYIGISYCYYKCSRSTTTSTHNTTSTSRNSNNNSSQNSQQIVAKIRQTNPESIGYRQDIQSNSSDDD